MTGFRIALARCRAYCALACTLSFAPLQAQDIPTDDQLQAAFGAVYNRLGLMEYCTRKGFADAGDVANTRKTVVATIAGMSVTAVALGQQEVGRRGDIVGPQIIGLMGSGNPARPGEVREGQTMSLADNARAQHSSERLLCNQMAEQASAVQRAGSIIASE
ncbi:hypothetical protein [Sphingomonas endolithica]|uniref:hypothetical protein n=1 Tax=Sphingomonas endolithica TaxID=2972485 RepID=UPI0021B08508|nr:hypothetical protein [Sphingomonas sp. ZFBP2030]